MRRVSARPRCAAIRLHDLADEGDRRFRAEKSHGCGNIVDMAHAPQRNACRVTVDHLAMRKPGVSRVDVELRGISDARRHRIYCYSVGG